LSKFDMKTKQSNSAIRQGARVQLIKNGKKIISFVPNDGCLNYNEDLTTGFVTFPVSDSRL